MRVKREPSGIDTPSERALNFQMAKDEFNAMRDLAAGLHAVGCDCVMGMQISEHSKVYELNACLLIAKALQDGTAYEVEVPDAVGEDGAK